MALLPSSKDDPLAQIYRETASMTDAVVRSVQTFPRPQPRCVCEGLEALLSLVADRLAVIAGALKQPPRGGPVQCPGGDPDRPGRQLQR